MMRIDINYNPTPKQAMYHSSNAYEMLYGGAAGGGKSCATVMEAFKLCMKHPKTFAYLFRRTYVELKDTLLREAMSKLPMNILRYNKSEHNIYLPNGSVMCFRHCNHEDDVINYQGAEIHWLFIDELTHFTKTIYDFLKTRVRSAAELGINPLIRCTSNPGGVGHGWVKQYFIDDIEPFKVNKKEVYSEVLRKSEIRTIQYIPAYATDNPHLAESYIFELEQKPERLRRALLNGDWTVFEGQAFMEFIDNRQHYQDRRYTHVIEPFRIPDTWKQRVWRSFDYGYAKPFSIGWWVFDYDGRAYRVNELYGWNGEANTGCKWTVSEIAKKVKEIEQEYFRNSVITGIADPAIWDKSGGNDESIAGMFEKERVYFEKAKNNRLSGKAQFHNRLAFDEEGLPMFYVFSTCKNFIRTIPNLVLDKVNVEDIDSDCEDHTYDEARYFFMEHPIKARKHHKPKQQGYNPLDDTQPTVNYGFMNL